MTDEPAFKLHVVGPIRRVTEPYPGSEIVPPAECHWNWGSHGCGRPPHEDGNHQCIDDETGEVCCEVDQQGFDAAGFKWDLWNVYD